MTSHFHGGLVLRHHKQMSCDHAALDAGMPSVLYITLSTNKGHTAKPLVSAGDWVLKGQVIAEPEHPLGGYCHAPTSGQIKAIEQRPSTMADARLALTLVLQPDGQDQWQTPPSMPPDQASSQAIITHIRQAGILGMGGAGFPTHIKYQQDQPVQTLIINGAECEPYISCDERLMLDHPTEIVRGTEWLLKAATADQAIIAIEDNVGGVKKQLDAVIQAAQINNISVVKVPTIYPTGGEKQLIKVLTGLEVPSGSTPLSLGIIMQNVATAKAVHDAMAHQQPLLSRLVTVTGDAVPRPGNYLALIGTPLSHLLQLAGCDATTVDKVIIGGPMMGYAMPTDEIGVDKTTNCILALPADCTKPEIEAMPCIRCGDCVKVCPQELLPQQLFWYINGNDEHNDLEKAREHHLFDCIECGACSWVCPSHINLVDFYRFAKSELTYLDHKKAKAEQAKQRHDDREARLARIKAERQAKRRNKTSKLADKKTAKKEISAVLDRIKKQTEQAKDE